MPKHCERDILELIWLLWILDIYLAPLEKLINSDRLTYLPNLYYRQYKLMEMLTMVRSEFPSQKVLLPRSETRHDNLLEQAKEMQFKLAEVTLNLFKEVKYRKAICFHLARNAKD